MNRDERYKVLPLLPSDVNMGPDEKKSEPVYFGQWIRINENARIKYKEVHTDDHDYCMHKDCLEPALEWFSAVLKGLE